MIVRKLSFVTVSLLALTNVVLAGCEVLLDPALYEDTGNGSNNGGSGQAAGDFPIVDKPEPETHTFEGCPAEGDGGDPENNVLKNREDEGDYVSVSYAAFMALSWPREIERRDRKNWGEEALAEIQQYEGTPVTIEGYLHSGKESGPESPNCHGTENEYVDWHVWLVENAGDDRTNSIVIETTPRVRDDHPNWTLKQVRIIAQNQLPVRISGWVFFDPEHPEQINKTRGTVWEIHPVMYMEVQVNGDWISLDDWDGSY